MKYLFPALVDRYNGNPSLRVIGGRLVRPSDTVPANYPGPHTVVVGTLSETLDTFGSDIERWNLEFGLVSQRHSPSDPDTWLEAMFEAFDDAPLISSAFSLIHCRVLNQDAPELEGHMFVAGCTVDVMIQRSVNNPVVRV